MKENRPQSEALNESLLDGWLSVSISIWNERLVTAMTYNESLVCNLLYKQHTRGRTPLTATDLCAKLHVHKPQMNVILNGLEKNGMIERIRSRADKRNVHILLTKKGIPVYEKAHQEILRLPEALIARLGEEKCRVFASTMKEAAACFDKMMNREEQRL